MSVPRVQGRGLSLSIRLHGLMTLDALFSGEPNFVLILKDALMKVA